jgi:hypothetical protein
LQNLPFKKPEQIGLTPCCSFGLEKNLETRQVSGVEIKNKTHRKARLYIKGGSLFRYPYGRDVPGGTSYLKNGDSSYRRACGASQNKDFFQNPYLPPCAATAPLLLRPALRSAQKNKFHSPCFRMGLFTVDP